MTSTEAMIYQLKNLKGKPLKQKLEHIFTYFWIPIVVVLAVLVFGISYIVHIVTMKDPALTVTCINAYSDTAKTDAYAEEFAGAAGIDLEEYEVRISGDVVISEMDLMTSYESAQVLVAQVAAQSIDVIAGDLEALTRYLYQDFFADLTQVLTPEQQAEYGDYFLYMDLAVLKQLEELVDTVPEYPDPTKPEEMEQPVPVALLLPEDGTFTELCYPHRKGQAAVGIVINSSNLPNALAFVDYIME